MLLLEEPHLLLQADMTIADDDQNPKPVKKLAKSLDAIAALRIAMEQRLAEAQKEEAQSVISQPKSPSPPQKEELQIEEPKPRTAAEPPKQEEPLKTEDSIHHEKIHDPAEWSQIMMHIAERSQKLIHEYVERNRGRPAIIPTLDPGHVVDAFTQLGNQVLHDPETFVNAQLALWQGYSKIWRNMLDRVQGKQIPSVFEPSPADKRFKDREWQTNWLFDYIKQSYLLTTQYVQGLVHKESSHLDPRIARKLEFYTRQMVDAVSPSNFWLTNPEVLRTTFESHGENLIKGLENLLHDLENGNGRLNVSKSYREAFRIGENLAATPGEVIYQNELIQLIQYKPQTETVFKTPLLIAPPWINKYYILDLQKKNSFIGYLVSQGYTVFCISWVNPEKKHASINFEDYMNDGLLSAMREVRKATGQDSINLLGYCIGGTLLATTLAYLEALKTPLPDLPKVASATYLVTLVDFTEPGDLGVFIDEEQIEAIEEHMAPRGYFEGSSLATTFNLLRANDLIWSFVINNYLLGRERFPFDILYWNGDSTNLPAAMHSYYLRNMYLNNNLCKPDALQMNGIPVDVRTINTPAFILSTRDDHIAPWKSTYASTQLYSGPVKFVLAGSGHVAGIINPPAANKYCYWTNDHLPASAKEWLNAAAQHKGSWWPEWLQWLKNYGGEQIPARTVNQSIEPAPGSYVKIQAN